MLVVLHLYCAYKSSGSNVKKAGFHETAEHKGREKKREANHKRCLTIEDKLRVHGGWGIG